MSGNGRNQYGHQSKYSDEDLAFMTAHYAEVGPRGCLARMPGRTYHAIVTKAKIMGLDKTRKAPSENAWTESEDQFMRENYALLGPAGIAKILTHRTKDSIRTRASTRKLKYLGPTFVKKTEPITHQAVVISDEVDDAPMIQRRVPQGEWRAYVPMVPRSVFEVAEA
jgi:hypothetical protein